MQNFHKMNTGIERVFRPTKDPGVYQEVLLHFIHFIDAEGKLIRSKLEKQIPGKLFRELREDEQHYRSTEGKVEYTFPNGETKILLGLSMTYGDRHYGIEGRFKEGRIN